MHNVMINPYVNTRDFETPRFDCPFVLLNSLEQVLNLHTTLSEDMQESIDDFKMYAEDAIKCGYLTKDMVEYPAVMRILKRLS